MDPVTVIWIVAFLSVVLSVLGSVRLTKRRRGLRCYNDIVCGEQFPLQQRREALRERRLQRLQQDQATAKLSVIRDSDASSRVSTIEQSVDELLDVRHPDQQDRQDQQQEQQHKPRLVDTPSSTATTEEPEEVDENDTEVLHLCDQATKTIVPGQDIDQQQQQERETAKRVALSRSSSSSSSSSNNNNNNNETIPMCLDGKTFFHVVNNLALIVVTNSMASAVQSVACDSSLKKRNSGPCVITTSPCSSSGSTGSLTTARRASLSPSNAAEDKLIESGFLQVA